MMPQVRAGSIPDLDESCFLCCSPSRGWFTRVIGCWIVDGAWVVLDLADGSQPLWSHVDEQVEVAFD